MRHSDQVAQLKKLFQHLDTGTTAMADSVYRHNVTDYTDPAQMALERDKLFRRQPLNLGLSCRAPEPGDFFTDDFSGVPILVVRDKDRTLKAFLNVCRHRGTKVAQDSGSGARAFTCPYHAWTYRLDGSLMSRPHESAFAEAEKECHGLTALPVEERHGMIWVCPTPGQEIDIDTQLGGLGDDMAAYRLASYSHYETRVLARDMNWKLVVDTFLEGYHIGTLHTETIAPYLHSDRATFDPFGRNLRMVVPRHGIDGLRERPEEEWDLITYSAVVNILFPNTVFIMQGDHLEIFHVYPDGDDPNRSRMYVSLYTPEPALSDSARGHWDRNFDLLIRTVEDEDFPLGEDIQRGFHSGAQEHITFGRNEPALGHYHRSIMQSLGLGAA